MVWHRPTQDVTSPSATESLPHPTTFDPSNPPDNAPTRRHRDIGGRMEGTPRKHPHDAMQEGEGGAREGGRGGGTRGRGRGRGRGLQAQSNTTFGSIHLQPHGFLVRRHIRIVTPTDGVVSTPKSADTSWGTPCRMPQQQGAETRTLPKQMKIYIDEREKYEEEMCAH